MNERLKELCVEAGGVMFGELCGTLNFDVERFAELVRQDEREACAVACESLALDDDYYTHFYVEAIRARGEK
jgi:hypothetical protein